MEIERKNKFITIGLMISLIVSALDQTIVDTATPRMIADLHGEVIFTWVIIIYMLASSVILPVVGKMADLYGRKIFFLLGMCIFITGSMFSGMASNMVNLIASRGVQGLGAGMLMPVIFTIVGDVFPGKQRAKMQGFFYAAYGLGSIIGPKLGGYITYHFSWRWVFFINLPIGIFAALIMFIYYKESKGERRGIDWLGSITVTVGLTCLLLAITSGSGTWLSNLHIHLGLFAGAILLLTLFILIEVKVQEPVLDLKLFMNKTFSLMCALAFITGAVMFGLSIFVPWFIQGVVGVNPDQAGTVMVPTMVAIMLGTIISGPLALRLTYMVEIIFGLAFILVGLILATQWNIQTTEWTVMIDAMLAGAGLGLITPVLTLAIQTAFPATHRGVVTSARTFFNQLGATIGVAIFGLIFNKQMAIQFGKKIEPILPTLRSSLNDAPAQTHEYFTNAFAHPQLLIRTLLRDDVRSFIPHDLRPQLVGTIKQMMATSLLAVFWTAIVLIVIGIGLSLFIGRVSLKHQTSKRYGRGMSSEELNGQYAETEY